jgi:hypothetical protein
MKKMILAAILAATLPALATAEMKMENTDPSPAPKPEHVMENTDPTPASVPAAPAAKSATPKKFVSSNAATLEGQESEAENEHRKEMKK